MSTRIMLVFLTALALGACSDSGTPEDPQTDRSLIQGKWERVASIIDSQSHEIEEGFYVQVSFTDTTASFVLAGEDGEVGEEGGRYVMNETASPKALDLFEKSGTVIKCCYRIDDTELIIVVPSDQLPDKRPTSVDDPEQGCMRTVFRRVDASAKR